MAILKKLRIKSNPQAEQLLTREILWKSQDGHWVVVEGPFPRGFPRSLTGKTPEIAIKRLHGDVMARDATTNDHPAKTHARLVLDAEDSGLGEVAP